MLSRLTIKNVALIDEAEIEFGEGLNVLSGETGAGKSVILDSVNFVLGAKADRSMIRYGEAECMVKAEFSVPENGRAARALREMDIETEGDIIISRRFGENGKNSIKINGCTVTAGMLRTVTDCLVDVHGQSEHFFLLKESNQLRTLDGVAGAPLKAEKEKLGTLLKALADVKERIALIGGNEQERGRRLDILDFQIREIENVGLKEGEEEELLARRNKINHLEKIISSVREASEFLSGDGGALDGLRGAKRAMGQIAGLDAEYEEISGRLESLALDADDLAATLSDLGEGLYFDEEEAQATENRLEEIRSLKRKYGADKAEIDGYLQKCREEYELLSDSEGKYAELTAEREKLGKKIYAACRKMTDIRRQAGEGFCRRVTEELKTLNIAHARFEIRFAPYAEGDAERATGNGLDEICFLFSANAGEPPKPLSKIISGGEMSRFMLAIKTQLSDVNEISTYIFDEIDAGISGKTAKVVGEKFAQIAKHTQIIAVSHLAQIAAMSDREFLIEKREESGKTYTRVCALGEEEKKGEIVRLLGGGEGEEFALKHAEELLRQAKQYKQSIN